MEAFMNELPLEQALRSMYLAYCESSGQQPPFISCQRLLLEAHRQGFADDDIRISVVHIKRQNQKFGNGARFSLRFTKLFEQGPDGALEHLGSILGEARADQRAREFRQKHSYSDEKASVLRATGRPDTKPLPEPQQAKQVMEGLLRKGFEDALKEAEESMRCKP